MVTVVMIIEVNAPFEQLALCHTLFSRRQVIPGCPGEQNLQRPGTLAHINLCSLQGRCGVGEYRTWEYLGSQVSTVASPGSWRWPSFFLNWRRGLASQCSCIRALSFHVSWEWTLTLFLPQLFISLLCWTLLPHLCSLSSAHLLPFSFPLWTVHSIETKVFLFSLLKLNGFYWFSLN